MSPSQDKAAGIRKTLDDARVGRASLIELASAEKSAAELNLPGCVSELRQHIAALAAPTTAMRKQALPSGLLGDVVVGVISGYFVQHLIR